MAWFKTPEDQLWRYIDASDEHILESVERWFVRRGGQDAPMVLEALSFLLSADEELLHEAEMTVPEARDKADRLAQLLSLLPVPIAQQKVVAALCLKLSPQTGQALLDSLHPALSTAALLELATQDEDLYAMTLLRTRLTEVITPMQRRELIVAIFRMKSHQLRHPDAQENSVLALKADATDWAFEQLAQSDLEDPVVLAALEGFLHPWNPRSEQAARYLNKDLVLSHAVEQYLLDGQTPWVYASTLEIMLTQSPEYQNLWEVRERAFGYVEKTGHTLGLKPLARRGDAQAIDAVIRQLFKAMSKEPGPVRSSDEKTLEIREILDQIAPILWGGDEFVKKLFDLVDEPLHMEHFGDGWEMQLITANMESALDWFVDHPRTATSNILRLYAEFRGDIQLSYAPDGENTLERPYSFEAFRLIARTELLKRQDPMYYAWGYLSRE